MITLCSMFQELSRKFKINFVDILLNLIDIIIITKELLEIDTDFLLLRH